MRSAHLLALSVGVWNAIATEGGACEEAALGSRAGVAMDACCPGGGHRRTQDGHADCSLPKLCTSSTCADIFVPFFSDCEKALQQPQFPFQQLLSFRSEADLLDRFEFPSERSLTRAFSSLQRGL